MKFICFVFIIITIVNGCTQDWECGNGPFRQCRKNITFSNGIAIDTVNNRIVFLAKHSGFINQQFFSLPLNGLQGGPLQYEYTIFGDQFYSTARYLYKYLPISKQLYVVKYEHHYASIRNYLQNGGYGFFQTALYPVDFEFDEVNSKTYQVSSQVLRSNFIPNQENQQLNNTNSDVVYTGFPNGYYGSGIGKSGNNLYIQVANYNNNNIYIGNSNCNNCPSTSLQLALSETGTSNAPFFMQGFDFSSSGEFFYTNYTKVLYQSSPNGSGGYNRKTLVDLSSTSDTIGDFAYYNGFVYYFAKNNLYRVSTTSSNAVPEVLYDGSKLSGDCMCGDGLSGPSCSDCSSATNAFRWENGYPSCIPIGSNGFPVNCVADYECNQPYGQCSGFATGMKICTCKSNFNGYKCQTCSGPVTWLNGEPTCTPNI